MPINAVSDIEVTAADLGALFGLSDRHVLRLIGTTKIARNRYRLGDATQALLEALTSTDDGAALTKERKRLVKAQADRAELELAKEKGEVAPLAEIERGWAKTMALIQARMLQVPSRAAVQIIRETDEGRIKSVLTSEIRQVLTDADAAISRAEWADDIDDPEGENAND